MVKTKIIHISDLHIDSKNSIIYGVNPIENLKKIIEIIKNIHNIDYVIASGDISNDGTEKSYYLADELLCSIGLPVYATVGNHDAKEVIEKIKDSLSCIQFPMELNVGDSLRFRFLDSVVKSEDGGNKGRGFIPKADLVALRDALASDFRKNILVIHHPSVEQGGDWIDRKMLTNRNDFNKVVTDSGNVLAVLSGHYHSTASDWINNVLFSIAPATSTTYGIYLKPYEEAYTPGFDILEIDEDFNMRKDSVFL